MTAARPQEPKSGLRGRNGDGSVNSFWKLTRCGAQERQVNMSIGSLKKRVIQRKNSVWEESAVRGGPPTCPQDPGLKDVGV